MVGGSTDVGLTTQRGARCEWGLPGGAPLVTLAPLLPGPAAAPRHRPPRPLALLRRPQLAGQEPHLPLLLEEGVISRRLFCQRLGSSNL